MQMHPLHARGDLRLRVRLCPIIYRDFGTVDESGIWVVL